jgi:hypothetical protein
MFNLGSLASSIGGSLLKSVVGGGSGKGSGSSAKMAAIMQQDSYRKKQGFVADQVERAAARADPKYRKRAAQEGPAKDVKYKEEIMSLYSSIPQTRVREAIVKQAERQGNMSATIKKMRYDLFEKKEEDPRTKPLQLEKSNTMVT